MKIRVSKRKWNFALVNAVLILLTLACLCVYLPIRGTLDSLDAADRWRGTSKERFAQIACFLPEDSTRAEGEILQLREKLDAAMVEASLEAAPEHQLYQDAYSARGTLTISSDRGSSEVSAIGVGGNFFLFHPLRLRSGSYISGDDLMDDRIVLDEIVAWQLFGGYDVAGQTVTISGKPYYVAGVVRREDDFATEKAYLDGAGIFLSYSALYSLTEQGITCYEIVLPDPISGFAMNVMKTNFDVGKGEMVENSARYRLKNLWTVIRGFGLRSMRANGVIYPYWENAVRLTEDWLALLLLLMILFALCPAFTALVLIIRLVIRGGREVKTRVPRSVDAAIERRREAAYAQRRK